MFNQKLPKFQSKAFFAPMAGISDPAFRLLCREEGAGMVTTELTNANFILQKNKDLKLEKKQITEILEFSPKESPVGIQLFGNDVDKIVEAAKIVEPFFDVIDFNMGCPAPHITNQMAGAALLQKPEFNEKLFTKLVNAVDKPVTLKMRAGVGENNCYLFKSIGKLAQDCGVSMLTLHPRTVKQGYSGKADWSRIKELKEHVNIPVVGNGDVTSPEDAKKMIEETGCDFVMIGRAARGNPSLFRQVNEYFKNGKYNLNLNSQIDALFKYLKYTSMYKIPFVAIRSQAIQFTKGFQNGASYRLRIGRSKSLEEIKDIFNELKKENE
ncbi:MAG: tRNA dihydrouridine synthase DusB [Candidatus Woesearchaeota archaeon]